MQTSRFAIIASKVSRLLRLPTGKAQLFAVIKNLRVDQQALQGKISDLRAALQRQTEKNRKAAEAIRKNRQSIDKLKSRLADRPVASRTPGQPGGEIETSIKHINRLFAIGNVVDTIAPDLQADCFIACDAQSLLPALQLKDNHDAKAYWYLRDHFSFAARQSACDSYDCDNARNWAALDRVMAGACHDLNGAITIGEGYRRLLADMSVHTVDLGRQIPISPDAKPMPACIQASLPNDPEPDTTLIASVANISPTNDIEGLLGAVSRLPKNYRLLQFGRFSDPQTENRARFAAATLGISHRVHFFRDLDRQDYLAALANCDLAIIHLSPLVPANQLGLHSQFADLLACSLPFVYSKNISAQHVDEIQKNCIEYEWTNAPDLAEKITELIGSANTRRRAMQKTLKSQNNARRRHIQAQADWIASIEADSIALLSAGNICTIEPAIELAQGFAARNCKVKLVSLERRSKWPGNEQDTTGIELYR